MSKARSTHYATGGAAGGIACGLPSPGSRAQGYMGGEHLRPATEDSVFSTLDRKRVDCKR